jgi:hypothetical protein
LARRAFPADTGSQAPQFVLKLIRNSPRQFGSRLTEGKRYVRPGSIETMDSFDRNDCEKLYKNKKFSSRLLNPWGNRPAKDNRLQQIAFGKNVFDKRNFYEIFVNYNVFHR